MWSSCEGTKLYWVSAKSYSLSHVQKDLNSRLEGILKTHDNYFPTDLHPLIIYFILLVTNLFGRKLSREQKTRICQGLVDFMKH